MLINEIRNYDLKDFQVEKKELKELKEKANGVNLSKCKDRPFLLKDYCSNKGRNDYCWSVFSVCSLAAMLCYSMWCAKHGMSGIGMFAGLLAGFFGFYISNVTSKKGTETKTWVLGAILTFAFCYIPVYPVVLFILNVATTSEGFSKYALLIASIILSVLYVIVVIAILVIRNRKGISTKLKEAYNAYLYRGMDQKEK